jgi:CheY-like chemotaxis protein
MPPDTTRARLLLVDDEEDLVWSLSTRLSKVRPRLTVVTAHDGDSALARVREEMFDLLIADVRMPGMNGLELVAHARDRAPWLPVVIMTAYARSDMPAVPPNVPTFLLEKPFDFALFLDCIDRALAATRGFSGTVSVQTLPEIVQLYVLSMATGVLRVRRPGGDGALFFEAGEITHASIAGGPAGASAFHAVMAWRGGEFSLELGVRPACRSIDASWQELVLESARRQDEMFREDMAPTKTGWTLVPPPEKERDR